MSSKNGLRNIQTIQIVRCRYDNSHFSSAEQSGPEQTQPILLQSHQVFYRIEPPPLKNYLEARSENTFGQRFRRCPIYCLCFSYLEMIRVRIFSEMIRIQARKSELQAKSRIYRPKVRVTAGQTPRIRTESPRKGRTPNGV